MQHMAAVAVVLLTFYNVNKKQLFPEAASLKESKVSPPFLPFIDQILIFFVFRDIT